MANPPHKERMLGQCSIRPFMGMQELAEVKSRPDEVFIRFSPLHFKTLGSGSKLKAVLAAKIAKEEMYEERISLEYVPYVENLWVGYLAAQLRLRMATTVAAVVGGPSQCAARRE